MGSSKEKSEDLSSAIYDAVNVLHALQDDDSTESSIVKLAAFENIYSAFQDCLSTRNKCCEDVRLPLKALDANNEYTVVWLHCDEELEDDIKEDTIKNLQYVFNHIEIFDSIQKCIDFLKQLDSLTTRLFLITSCFYDGMRSGTVSPMADQNSDLALVLRHFKFEHHVHDHASQWSSPNYIYSLCEIFMDAKFDDDARKLFFSEASNPISQVIWLHSIENEQLEQRLRSVFSSIEIYDEQQKCFNYVKTIDPMKVHVYFIIDDLNTEFEWKKFVKTIYEVPSNTDDINCFVLKIRSDVRGESGTSINCIERSTRHISDKYAPFTSLMGNLELYVALSCHTNDRNRMKEEMLAACRLVYHNNDAYLKMIDKFEAEYNSSIKGQAIRWYTNDSFVYRLVNRVLRTNDPDLIHPYRFFINDLYDELQSIDREYCEDLDDLVVYRGQCITEVELDYLKHYVGQLLTLASFTSTTVDRDIALIFSKCRENLIGILVEIHLNINLDNTRPFAFVGSYSAMPDELEVLISMGTIFKLVSVSYDSDSEVWLVVLDLCRVHSCDVRDILPRNNSESKYFENSESFPFRRLSTPTTTKFDANLRQFNRTLDMYKKSAEKTQSLPILTTEDKERPISRSDSLRSTHNLNASKIKLNMKVFQRKQQRKRNKSKSYPYLFKLSNLFQRPSPSLPILPTMSNKSLRYPVIPRFLLERTTITDDTHNDQSFQTGLFTAGIHDTLLVFNYLIEEETDTTISLKQQVDTLRHDLRSTFNIEKGRWCCEY